MSVFVLSNTFQRRQTVAFLARVTLCTRLDLGWFVQGCIQAQASDHTDRILQLAELPQELDDRKTAVCNYHEEPFGEPATSLQDRLQCPLREFLMPSNLALVIALRRCQHREKG